jgi:hypothetical protein
VFDFHGVFDRREIKIVEMLKFISSTVWRTLFGKNAESLERSTDNEDECEIRGWIIEIILNCSECSVLGFRSPLFFSSLDSLFRHDF